MKITPRVHALKIPFQIPLGPGKSLDRFVYSYVISGDRPCLIDSGVAGSAELILDSLAKIQNNNKDIAWLVLTHAHPDHIGAAQSIQKHSGCRIAAHAAAQARVEDVEQQFRDRPVPGFHALVEGSVKVDRCLADNDRLDLGDGSLQVIHTPGHSRCSISLLCAEEGVLFAGDAIPQGNDLPIYDNVVEAVASIRRLRKIEGIKYILSSWSDPEPTTDPYRLMDNGLLYFQKIHTAIRQLPAPESITEPMELCRQMVEKLGLPEVAVNPIVAHSFFSHLPQINQEQL